MPPAEVDAITLAFDGEPWLTVRRPDRVARAELLAAFHATSDDAEFMVRALQVTAGMSRTLAQAEWDDASPADAAALLEAVLAVCSPASLDVATRQLTHDGRLAAEMAYCGPHGIPHSVFLSWSESDQDLALAWSRRRAETCDRCGTHPDEWRSNPDAYVADLHHCHGCERLAEGRKMLPAEGADGVDVTLVPPTADADPAGSEAV